MRPTVKEKIYIDNPAEHIGKLVHVDGWAHACVFRLVAVQGTLHFLKTPKTGKSYQTRNRLYMTNRNAERHVAAKSWHEKD